MKFQLPLAWRLIAATLVIVAGVSLVIGRMSFNEDKALLEQAQHKLGEAMARSGAVSCLEPLLVRDYPVLDTYVQDQVRDDEDVLEVQVLRDGEILSRAGREGAVGGLFSLHVAPIQIESEGEELVVLGSVQLTLSSARLTAALEQRAREIIYLSLASIVAIAGILSFLLRRQLGSPLETLDARTRALSEGDFETPVPQVGSAELGRLAGTLDEMRVNVRDAHAGLESRNEELIKIGGEKDAALEDLSVALGRAKAAEKARAEFLANMSHELCTPLNGILGLTDLLKRDMLPGENWEWVRDVQRSGQEMLRLVRSVLDWSAIEREAVQVERTPIDVVEIAEEQIDLVRERAREKGLKLKLELQPGLVGTREGDRSRLGQVLGELLNNAVKFTDSGEVLCRIGTVGADGQISMEVLDTGPGVSGQFLDQLFEAFQQADGTTTRSHGGAGLGLAISARLAELMGGKLLASPRSTGGLAMALELPLPITEESDVMEEVDDDRVLRVLVVDDNAVNRKLASVVVTRGGHETVAASDGAKAVEAFERESFDVILMDVQMPVMDGFEATRRIREIERQRGAQPVLILAVTAGAFEGGAAQCREAGMDGYLAKPVSYERLLSSVEACGVRLHQAG